MIFSQDLLKWTVSSILQAQAALLGFSVAGISISMTFLYRDGQFNNSPDKYFKEFFKDLEDHIVKSFAYGGSAMTFSIILLIILENIFNTFSRIGLALIISVALIMSTYHCYKIASIFIAILKKHSRPKINITSHYIENNKNEILKILQVINDKNRIIKENYDVNVLAQLENNNYVKRKSKYHEQYKVLTNRGKKLLNKL